MKILPTKLDVQSVPVNAEDSIRLHITEPESEDAWITLLCLHGWTLDYHSFSSQCDLASEGIRVARFDRRGFGASGLTPEFEREVEDVLALIDHLTGPVALYGVSQGARLGLRCATAGHDRLVGLVTQGGHVDGLVVEETDGEAIPFHRYADWFRAGDISAFQHHWLKHPLNAYDVENLSLKKRVALIAAYDGQDLLLPGALPHTLDIREALAHCGVPILAIIGEWETLSRKSHAKQLARMAEASIITINGGGHLCNVSQPEAVNLAILRWLKSLGND